ncbi:MAG: hypothetical protein KF857_03005 [Fimbriimonadaceae bacterium]|nr:hypothetical protein [Fimbriimonadaceae bacterium]
MGGDLCRFAAPLTGFKPSAVNDRKVVFRGPETANLPSVLRVNLSSPGFEGFFGAGFTLGFTTNLSPLLSWADGTVDAGLPTPEGRWALLSFEDKQPPILIVFERPVSLMVSGKSGDWKLATSKPYKGWVRFCLPTGQRKVASTAHDLGVVTREVVKHEKLWTGPTPELLDLDIKQEGDHIVAVWTFDHPNALVPVGVLFARQGGYPLRSLTGVVETTADLFEGPVAYCPEAKMSITFPCRRVPLGRPLVVGSTPFDLPATVSGLDLDGVASLALATLTGDRPASAVEMVRQVSDEYAHGLLASREPLTDSPQTLGADGRGIDLLAAHSLAVQATAWGEGHDSQRNPWLADVLKRRDWWTWTLSADDVKQSRRAAALACVAAELCPEIDRRLSAAMLNAGLASQDVLAEYRAKRGFPALDTGGEEPLARLRKGLFSEGPAPLVTDPSLAALFASVRVLSPTQVHVSAEKDGYVLWWEPETAGQGDLLLASAWPFEVEPRENLASVVPQPAVGTMALRFMPKGKGPCSVMMRFPKYAEPLPPAAKPFTYDK